MTLFFMVIDCKNKWIQWVRAGHDSAEIIMIFCSSRSLGKAGSVLRSAMWRVTEFLQRF